MEGAPGPHAGRRDALTRRRRGEPDPDGDGIGCHFPLSRPFQPHLYYSCMMHLAFVAANWSAGVSTPGAKRMGHGWLAGAALLAFSSSYTHRLCWGRVVRVRARLVPKTKFF